MTVATDRPATQTTGPSTAQMRRLHGLLRDHGITGDKTVLEYVNADLAEHREDPVDSRRDLSPAQVDRIISDLEHAEVAHTATAAGLQRLRSPFPDEAIGHLPRATCSACSDKRVQGPGGKGTCDLHPRKGTCQVCGNYHNQQATIHITYVGHADVTARLLEVDPTWTWEPMATDPTGMPVLDRTGGLWIRLTVLGVTRPGYGDTTGTGGVKEAIGDALRNAAMRFGVALDLWAKGDREWAHAEKHGTNQHPDEAQPGQDLPAREWTGPSTSDLLTQIDTHAQRAGVDYSTATQKFRDQRGLSLDDLDTLEPWVVAPLAQAVKERADQVVAEREAAERAEQEKAAQQPDASTDGADGQDQALPEPGGPDDPWATPGPGASGEQPAEA